MEAFAFVSWSASQSYEISFFMSSIPGDMLKGYHSSLLAVITRGKGICIKRSQRIKPQRYDVMKQRSAKIHRETQTNINAACAMEWKSSGLKRSNISAS